MPLVNTDRLVSSRRYLMVRQRERRFACLAPWSPHTAHPGFVRSVLSEADHSGSLSGSRPMQQRLVCVEAGQQDSLPPHTGKVGNALRTGLARPHVRHAVRSSFIHRVWMRISRI